MTVYALPWISTRRFRGALLVRSRARMALSWIPIVLLWCLHGLPEFSRAALVRLSWCFHRDFRWCTHHYHRLPRGAFMALSWNFHGLPLCCHRGSMDFYYALWYFHGTFKELSWGAFMTLAWNGVGFPYLLHGASWRGLYENVVLS